VVRRLMLTPAARAHGRPGRGGRQVALVWMEVLGARVERVRMGADLALAVADVVPALHLKERGSVPPPFQRPRALVLHNDARGSGFQAAATSVVSG
jgi:hypothetical protein